MPINAHMVRPVRRMVHGVTQSTNMPVRWTAKVYVLLDSSKFHQVTAIQTLDPADVTVISERGDDDLASLTTLIYE